ncbi:MAG TPA: substrate-binding domain-containing protein [Steroidobacteraceae bacterium]|nr:substrate-binding domain-containing protein [Steroidobacteraceae bacterium]
MTERPLKLLSSMAARELLAELVARFQREGGRAVHADAAGGVDVARRIAGGEPCDVVVLAANAIDQLGTAGAVLAGSRTDLVRSGVAIAVRADAPRPGIATPADVKAAVLAAASLSYSTGPSGVYLEKLFGQWGILGQIRPRIVVPPPGVPVGALVADGRAALGFQQLSELMSLPGIAVLGPLPAAIQTVTVFSGGICAASTEAPAARALLDFLASPAVAAEKLRYGMEPAA